MVDFLHNATPKARSIDDYQSIAPENVQELKVLAKQVSDCTIWHINSAAQGGGVAELLQSQVALEQGLGINSTWLVVQPSDPTFFTVTRKIHNGFQGDITELTAAEWTLYETESKNFTESLQKKAAHHLPDLIVCHDPQPLLAVVNLNLDVPKILRIHPDICSPSTWSVDWLCEQASSFDRVIVSRRDCQPLCLMNAGTSVIAPAIDPLAEKNIELPQEECSSILFNHGIDPERPIISEISRFDKWKDQLGVLEAYKHAKQEIPDLQVVFVGFITAEDDPDATEYSQQVQKAAKNDPDVHIFNHLSQLKNTSQETFVNAVQTKSDIVIQKSLREGFGLTVTEAMLKGTPVIGSSTGGIILQIQHDENGILVNSVEETTQAILYLLRNPEERQRLGQAGKLSAKKHFLLPHYLLQHVTLYTSLFQKK